LLKKKKTEQMKANDRLFYILFMTTFTKIELNLWRNLQILDSDIFYIKNIVKQILCCIVSNPNAIIINAGVVCVVLNCTLWILKLPVYHKNAQCVIYNPLFK